MLLELQSCIRRGANVPPIVWTLVCNQTTECQAACSLALCCKNALEGFRNSAWYSLHVLLDQSKMLLASVEEDHVRTAMSTWLVRKHTTLSEQTKLVRLHREWHMLMRNAILCPLPCPWKEGCSGYIDEEKTCKWALLQEKLLQMLDKFSLTSYTVCGFGSTYKMHWSMSTNSSLRSVAFPRLAFDIECWRTHKRTTYVTHTFEYKHGAAKNYSVVSSGGCELRIQSLASFSSLLCPIEFTTKEECFWDDNISIGFESLADIVGCSVGEVAGSISSWKWFFRTWSLCGAYLCMCKNNKDCLPVERVDGASPWNKQ